MRLIKILLLTAIVAAGCSSQNSSGSFNMAKVQKGRDLFNTVGCTKCHSINGEIRYGPALNTLMDSAQLVIRQGRRVSVKVDRAYIMRSLEDPDYEKVYRFRNKKMSKLNLTQEEINDLADYLLYINTSPVARH